MVALNEFPTVYSGCIDLPEENLSDEDLEKYIGEKLWPYWDTIRYELRLLEAWARGKQPEPRTIANTERKVLQSLSRTPWMRLMVSSFAQQVLVDGYRKAGTNEDAKAWTTWQRNNMPSQQIALNRSIITFGYSYLKVTEGTAPDSDEVMAVMRAKSPMKVVCLFEDSYGDEWPAYALEKMPDGTYTWWTETEQVFLKHSQGKFKITGRALHGYTHPPFVRYANEIDLDGKCWGDVEPVIELAARIDKTAFDRLLVQHYNSFKIRWATGLEQPDSEPDVEQTKMRLSNEDILISSKIEAKFGTLDETAMAPFIEAYEADLKAFLIACQLPASLAGQIVNVAADALAQSNRPTIQKLHEKQTMYGQSHDQAMRFVNLIEGRDDEAYDFDFGVHWQDVEVVSLSQFADAWGKMVEQLKIPAWGVWDMIPNVDQQTIEGWKEDYLSNDPVAKYIRELSEKPATNAFGQQGGPNGSGNGQKVSNDTGNPKPTKVKTSGN